MLSITIPGSLSLPSPRNTTNNYLLNLSLNWFSLTFARGWNVLWEEDSTRKAKAYFDLWLSGIPNDLRYFGWQFACKVTVFQIWLQQFELNKFNLSESSTRGIKYFNLHCCMKKCFLQFYELPWYSHGTPLWIQEHCRNLCTRPISDI